MNKKKKRFDRALKELIENTVKSTYSEYGYEGTAEVQVILQKKITITVNTEKPYMGEQFWEFLETVREKLEETLKITGYTPTKTEYYYDFCTITYAFTACGSNDSKK